MWLEPSERGGEREEGRAGGGEGRELVRQVVQGLAGQLWLFTPGKVGAMEGSEQMRVGSCLTCSQVPSGCCKRDRA